MAQGQLRSFLSLIALICLIGGTFATALGLMKIGSDPSETMISDEEYIVPAAVGNTLCVIFLIWLTATVPTRSTAYKLIVIIFLLIGLIGEIYLTMFFTKPPVVYGTYVLVVTNFLIRTFYVLEYVQDTWSPVSWNDYLGSPKASSSSSKSSSEKKPEAKKEEKPKVAMDERAKEFRTRLDEVINKMRADSRKIKGPTIGESIGVFKSEIAAGKSPEDAYKAAKDTLRYGDDSSYTGASRRRA